MCKYIYIYIKEGVWGYLEIYYFLKSKSGVCLILEVFSFMFWEVWVVLWVVVVWFLGVIGRRWVLCM